MIPKFEEVQVWLNKAGLSKRWEKWTAMAGIVLVLALVLGAIKNLLGPKEVSNPAAHTAPKAVSDAIAGLRKELQSKGLQEQDQIKALTETVQALANKQDATGVKEALAALARGQTEAAKAIFAKTVEGAAANQEAAEAARHLGALAFLDDTEEALRWYRRAVELDPANVDGWDQLGHLYHRTGQLDQAEAAHRKVITLGEANGDMRVIVIGTVNLGLIYDTRGELDRAEEMHKKALAINEKLGRQEDMGIQYGNLGVIYQMRDELDGAEEMHELDRAEEMLEKSLAIHEKLGHSEGIAKDYSNFGLLYQTRGELDRAEKMLEKSLALFKQIGAMPMVEQVQTQLDTVNKSRER